MSEKSKSDKSPTSKPKVSAVDGEDEVPSKSKKKAASNQPKVAEPVVQVVEKTKKRRRYPLVKLLVILICMAIAAGYVWQYRQFEIDKKAETIETLRSDARQYLAEKKEVEEEKKALEARFTTFETDSFSMKVLATWVLKPTQFPLEETVIGDENTTIRVINSETRNSVSNFIPKVDYLWQIGDNQGQLEVINQSLHCERFDTIDNELPLTLREHNGFNVYCDTDGEKVVIGALATPEKYGTENTNTYFIIEVNDLQQANFEEIVTYIESFVAK